MRKQNNGQKSAGQEIFVSCPALFSSVLHDLLHEGAYGLSSLVLLLPRGVGVGAEGESGIVVPQHAGYGLHVYTVLQGRGSEGVAEIMEANMRESGVLQDLLVKVHHGVRMVHLSSKRRGKHVGAVRVFVMLLDQQIYCRLRNRYQPHGIFCLGTGELQGAVRVPDILLAYGDGFVSDVQIVPS